MKIFEYSWKSGKGEQIGDAKFGGVGQRIGHHGMYRIHSYLSIIDYTSEDGIKHVCVNSEHFSEEVDAILCCTGEYEEGWNWVIITTEELTEKAQQRNMKQFGTKYCKEKVQQ